MKYAEISAEGEKVGVSTRAVRPLASALKQIARERDPLALWFSELATVAVPVEVMDSSEAKP